MSTPKNIRKEDYKKLIGKKVHVKNSPVIVVQVNIEMSIYAMVRVVPEDAVDTNVFPKWYFLQELDESEEDLTALIS